MAYLPTRTFNTLFLAGLSNFALAHGETTVSLGYDYSVGRYGESEKSHSWMIPLGVKYESGPMTLKLSIPYVRSSGTAAAGGDLFAPADQTQSGLGDLITSALWTVYSDKPSGLGIDLGGKIKFATADRSKDLLTTGENDYSLQADAYRSFAGIKLFGSLGWTLKGDPEGINYRNPWFGTLGFSQQLSDANTWGSFYDYRQKLSQQGAPVSEAMLFLTHRYSKQWKLQGYVVAGFSDASPDFGIGTVVSYTY